MLRSVPVPRVRVLLPIQESNESRQIGAATAMYALLTEPGRGIIQQPTQAIR